ncbi:MAG TPA: hypothetical protein VF339_18940 [Gammaproteobacteria bacterium]
MSPLDQPGETERRDVCARDHEQQQRAAERREQRGADRRRSVRLHRLQQDAALLRLEPPLVLDVALQRRELGRGRRLVDARTKPPDDRREQPVARRARDVLRDPDQPLHAEDRQPRLGRQHADDRVRGAVELDRLADDVCRDPKRCRQNAWLSTAGADSVSAGPNGLPSAATRRATRCRRSSDRAPPRR